MAPEVSTDGRPSDVWSLGCILYEMVHGTTHFDNLSPEEKLIEISDAAYEIPFPQETSLGNPEKSYHVSSLITDILKSCLERDPAKRPS